MSTPRYEIDRYLTNKARDVFPGSEVRRTLLPAGVRWVLHCAPRRVNGLELPLYEPSTDTRPAQGAAAFHIARRTLYRILREARS